MSASPPPTVSWQSPESQAGPAPGVEFAPHGGRLVAYIIDSIIISIVLVIIFTIGAFALGSGATVEGNQVTQSRRARRSSPRSCSSSGSWSACCTSRSSGRAAGRRRGCARSACASSATATGEPIGWGTALLRLVGLVIAGAVFYLGYIWIFIDKRRRGWQDLIAGTIVVKQP